MRAAGVAKHREIALTVDSFIFIHRMKIFSYQKTSYHAELDKKRTPLPKWSRGWGRLGLRPSGERRGEARKNLRAEICIERCGIVFFVLREAVKQWDGEVEVLRGKDLF